MRRKNGAQHSPCRNGSATDVLGGGFSKCVHALTHKRHRSTHTTSVKPVTGGWNETGDHWRSWPGFLARSVTFPGASKPWVLTAEPVCWSTPVVFSAVVRIPGCCQTSWLLSDFLAVVRLPGCCQTSCLSQPIQAPFSWLLSVFLFVAQPEPPLFLPVVCLAACRTRPIRCFPGCCKFSCLLWCGSPGYPKFCCERVLRNPHCFVFSSCRLVSESPFGACMA